MATFQATRIRTREQLSHPVLLDKPAESITAREVREWSYPVVIVREGDQVIFRSSVMRRGTVERITKKRVAITTRQKGGWDPGKIRRTFISFKTGRAGLDHGQMVVSRNLGKEGEE